MQTNEQKYLIRRQRPICIKESQKTVKNYDMGRFCSKQKVPPPPINDWPAKIKRNSTTLYEVLCKSIEYDGNH